MKRNIRSLMAALLMALPVATQAQSQIYPEHFDLAQVRLLDGPMRTAMNLNDELLMQYDVDRLLTPFVRQAGLSTGKYAGWVAAHPSFPNWGQADWSLEGHVGGHYLTALALAYAASDDEAMRTRLKSRLDYMLDVLDDCQSAYDGNTQGLYGFIGGQPINQIWTGLYAGNLAPFKQFGGWVPFYCEHKVLAGLRDAWLYTGSTLARDLYKKMCDWSVLVVSNLTEAQMQDILGWEHGGMNEPLADAYLLFGENKYLEAAKKYSHQWMVNEMQTLNTTFLDGKHANTQVPKYIGFERIYQVEDAATKTSSRKYHTAALNFWLDVAQNRTVCIGGNSVGEHFLAANRASQYIDNLDGPESCNTNNMLKLSEDLFDATHDARYADFYEAATWNHILSTQDPTTGGYVYFTTLRPQGYRIYSRVNQGMWCCVGTGMENHAKYAHFIYTHSQDNSVLYVNLFTASRLVSDDFVVTQQTQFPYEQQTQLTIEKGGTFTLALRHPAWAANGYAVSVNGTPVDITVTKGKASYVKIEREWAAGDVVTVALPMELRYEACPNYTDYIAFKYGPILLAAQTTVASADEANATGLAFEALQNEYGGEGRMDHAPGARARSLGISTSPLLIGPRADVLSRISPTAEPLTFNLEVNRGKWRTLQLRPFYTIHHARYSCYFYQQTEEEFAKTDMAWADQQEQLLESRTLDFVATGEQQSEAGHQGKYSSDSGKGSYNGEFYRDAQSGGWFEYVLETGGQTENVALLLRMTTADAGRVGTVYIDGTELTTLTVPSFHSLAEGNGFYNDEYPVPAELLTNADGTPKQQVTFRFVASGTTPIPGLYYVRLLSDFGSNDYRFVASDWTTGDAGRVAANKFYPNAEKNTLRINAGTGANNVCLMLDTSKKTYMVNQEQKYLLVKGTNLSTAAGASYLWWLNGKNRGSSVEPTIVTTADDGEVIIAWDLTTSGIDDNCRGHRWNFCYGQTIFGLTSLKMFCTITHIGFYASLDDFYTYTGIGGVPSAKSGAQPAEAVFDLQGRRLDTALTTLPHGIYIVGGKKVLR